MYIKPIKEIEYKKLFVDANGKDKQFKDYTRNEKIVYIVGLLIFLGLFALLAIFLISVLV